MKQYLLSMYQPEADAPPALLEQVMHQIEVLNQEIKASGAWVFTGGLHPPSTATVVHTRHGETLLTDGPFVEGKEHIGGIYVLQATDLDAVLVWARKLSLATTLSIEVRPFQDQIEI